MTTQTLDVRALDQDADDAAPAASRSLVSRLPWPLLPIVAAQAALSARLLHRNSAFLDEATYIYAGHQVLDHWFHGASVAGYETYFSGSPDIYPPLAALADDLGGLTGARILSMVFMLGVTTTLFLAARRLYGGLAAFIGSALFVTLASTQYLTAFATYDAMALFLITLAAYCVIRAGDAPMNDEGDGTWYWVAGAVVTALANATKYATALYDPVVIALAALVVLRRQRVKPGLGRAAAVATVVSACLGLLLAVGGSMYVTGIKSTTLERAQSVDKASVVFSDTWHWIGWLLVVAAVGLAIVAVGTVRRRNTVTLDEVGGTATLGARRYTDLAIAAVLVFAGVMAPLNQARIHTTTSLSKHVDFGAWFAAIVAGYAIVALARILRNRWAVAGLALALTAALAVPAGATGYHQSDHFFASWPNAATLKDSLSPLVHKGDEHYLVEDYDVAAYYLGPQVRWQQWQDTWYFTYIDPETHQVLSGVPAWTDAVKHHYFSLVVLDFGDTAAVDHQITAAMKQYGHYHVIGEATYTDAFGTGQFTIWQYWS